MIRDMIARLYEGLVWLLILGMVLALLGSVAFILYSGTVLSIRYWDIAKYVYLILFGTLIGTYLIGWFSVKMTGGQGLF